jgi:hypothetical protein
MNTRERRDLEIIAENSTDDKAMVAMTELRAINPSYHWCPDWDYMVICDTDSEWDTCTCTRWKKLIQKATEKPIK